MLVRSAFYSRTRLADRGCLCAFSCHSSPLPPLLSLPSTFSEDFVCNPAVLELVVVADAALSLPQILQALGLHLLPLLALMFAESHLG